MRSTSDLIHIQDQLVRSNGTPEQIKKAMSAFIEKRDSYTHNFTGLIVPFQKSEGEKRLVTGIVLEPDEVDSQGDTISAEAIERSAHRFLARYNRGASMGLMHKMFGDIGVDLAESYITQEDTTIGDEAVKKGSWVMTVKVVEDELWEKIKSGAITGFSIGGTATVEQAEES